jgi:transcriptional regulator with XRE-family HTH domain
MKRSFTMIAAAYLSQLNSRRIELGMSFLALANRSGVSLPTVQRTLAGEHVAASFASVVALSEALGMEFSLAPRVTAHAFTETRAQEKAERLVRIVQGTAGLEGQAVDAEKRKELVDNALHCMMQGSRRKLWTD